MWAGHKVAQNLLAYIKDRSRSESVQEIKGRYSRFKDDYYNIYIISEFWAVVYLLTTAVYTVLGF